MGASNGDGDLQRTSRYDASSGSPNSSSRNSQTVVRPAFVVARPLSKRNTRHHDRGQQLDSKVRRFKAQERRLLKAQRDLQEAERAMKTLRKDTEQEVKLYQEQICARVGLAEHYSEALRDISRSMDDARDIVIELASISN